MRRISLFSALALLATWITLVAVQGGVRGPELTATVSAQGTPDTLGYSHVEIPFFQDWVNSGHADLTAEAFVHWNGDDPPLVPTSCGQCHSSAGHQDYIGLDGSEAGVVDEASEPGVIQCTTCHNEVSVNRDQVTMPSGVVLGDLGREATCMTCHQGRASGATVATAIEEAGVDRDEVMAEQGFINIHYYAAAATLYGSEAGGGFEYPGKTYEPRFDHVENFDTCQSCHDPHTLEVRVDSCSTCHWDVTSAEDLPEIRMQGSYVDYDGDGDVRTGIATEIANLRETLLETMQTYASEVVGTPFGYDAHAYPYVFVDTDGDGTISAEEANYGNRYTSFTPRLLAAAYNFQVATKDPGNYAHNAKYTIQLLYDSIEDLNAAIGETTMGLVRPSDDDALAQAPADAVLAQAASYDHANVAAQIPIDAHMLEALRRDDAGHFDATSEAWRHWDEDGAVSASCATCHSADGLPFFAEHGTQIEQDVAQGMECTTCHTGVDTGDFAMIEREEVTFPSGAVLSFGNDGDNLCATCHQGRESSVSVDRRIGDTEDDVVSEDLGFINVHYFAAAATRFGGEAAGGYQYDGKDYVGLWPHDESVSTCTSCHNPHNQQVDIVDTCSECHTDAATIADVRDFREFEGDWDGDGDTSVGTYYEIANLEQMLYEAMRAYARDTDGVEPIVYDGHSYPYFFTDANDNGEVDEDDGRYGTWTPRLLRAAYNYQYAQKDTGDYVHNSQYVIQLLHDSLQDLGVDVGAMDRPAAGLF